MKYAVYEKRWWLWGLIAIVILSAMNAAYELGKGSENRGNTGVAAETENTTELTDAEWEQIQAIFTEYVEKEIEYRPAYCGE